MADDHEFKLITDEALGESKGFTEDGLDFKRYAEVLSKAAKATPGPFTIGVFGDWGTGKTSLLRYTEKLLLEDDDSLTVWFNAWQFEREEHPIVPLIATIIQSIQSQQNFRDKLGDKGRSLIRSLRAVAYGFSAKSTIKVPGFAEFEASFVAKDMMDREKELAPDPLLDRSIYYDAFEVLRSMSIASEGRRIVVFVDDLDRCFPNSAVRLLESMKLVLNQPGFVFFLGVSRKVIEQHLEHLHKKDFGVDWEQGAQYLDKIIQLPFFLPSSESRIEGFVDRLVRRVPEPIRPAMAEVLQVVGEAAGANPRSIIRFANGLLLDAEIATGVDLKYFAITRCIQHLWPKEFDVLTKIAEVPGEVVEQGVDSFCKTATEHEHPAVRTFASTLRLDLRFQRLLESAAGKSWLGDENERVQSVEFLRQVAVSIEPTPAAAQGWISFAFISDVPSRCPGSFDQINNRVRALAGARSVFATDIPPGLDSANARTVIGDAAVIVAVLDQSLMLDEGVRGALESNSGPGPALVAILNSSLWDNDNRLRDISRPDPLRDIFGQVPLVTKIYGRLEEVPDVAARAILSIDTVS